MNKAAKDKRVGIIDIGSNSIRIVVYDEQKRSPIPIYNEKVLCALGKGLSITGKLNPEGVDMAKDSLHRFITLGRNMRIVTLYIVATAAVRDASDGAEFVSWLESEYNVKVDIISGKEEAKLGAFAVCSSIHKPEGVIADLGGGSLELVGVTGDVSEKHISLPLGSLRMQDESGGDVSRLKKIVDDNLRHENWISDKKIKNIYLIGGSFRALAKIHMQENNYPLKILHEYEVNTKDFIPFIKAIIDTPLNRLSKFSGCSTKRIASLHGAAMILLRLTELSKAKKIVFSASGIREGYLYKKLPASQRSDDNLLFSGRAFASRNGRSISYAQELFEWIQPLFPDESDKEKRLRLAFCLFSDIALHIHPEYRAQWAFQRIIYGSFTSITHTERVTLALALYYRYRFRLKDEPVYLSLIGNKEKKIAKILGTAVNLAYSLSGSVDGSLPKTKLIVGSGSIAIDINSSMKDVVGDIISKRIELLNEAYFSEYYE
ncbi:MAG: Ppx/GppA family phosphatase [Rickettsiales bacterium]